MLTRVRVRRAANDAYWDRGMRLAVGTLWGVLLGGTAALLLVGQFGG
jgi:hypothetical protein